MEIFDVYLSSNDLNLIAVNALVATSLYMTMIAGVFSIGQVAFMAMGAYGFGFATVEMELHAGVAIGAGALIAGLIAAVASIPLLRASGIYLAIITIALIRIVQLTVASSDSLGGVQGLYGDLSTATWPAWTFLFVSLAVVWAAMRLPIGAGLRALGEDEELARSLGIYTPGMKIAVFVAGGMLAGLAGALYGQSIGWIAPQLFGFDRAIEVVLFAVVGGFGSAFSPAIGAALLTFLAVATRQFGEWRDVGFGLAILLIIIVRPRGLFNGLGSVLGSVFGFARARMTSRARGARDRPASQTEAGAGRTAAP